jgi:ZIP family zinc transporter
LELLVTFLAGMSMAVGALFVKLFRDPHRLSHASSALALGAMLALALFDLGPESVGFARETGAPSALLLVAAGFGLLALLELFIPDHDDAAAHEHHVSEDAIEAHIGLISVVALALHNLVEGMAMYALADASLQQGAVYAFGVALHNIPMGMLVFTALRSERRGVKALAFGGALLSTVAGGLVMMLLSGYVSDHVMEMLTCVAFGMILYIAFVELVPHVVRTRPAWASAVGVACGLVLVWCASLLE